MASANNFLAASSGGGNTNSNPFPFMYVRDIFIALKDGRESVLESDSAGFYAALPAATGVMDVDQEVTINTSSIAGTVEIYNVTNATGGTLTTVMSQVATAGSNYNIVITRDGNNVTTIPVVNSLLTGRVCLGGFLPVETTVGNISTSPGQGHDRGFDIFTATLVPPVVAFALGVGLEFNSTCVVEIELISGSLVTSSTDFENRSFCASVLRKRIV